MSVLVAVAVVIVSLYASGYDLQTVEEKYEITKTEKVDASTMISPQTPILVRVTGYGAYENDKDRKSESKRLMVLRASKLDAYRNLAERIYGTTISGNTTVQDYQLQHDGVSSMVDSVVRGAKVVSITEHKERGVETVLEVMLPGDFGDCLNKVNNFKYGRNCLQAMPQSAPKVVHTGSSEKSTMGQNYYLQ